MPTTNATPAVYLVHPDREERERLRALIARDGFRVRDFASAESFLSAREARAGGCLVIGLAGRSAGDLLERIRAEGAGMPAILIAALGGVPAAVHAMRAGASAFLEEPVSRGALTLEIRRFFVAEAS